MIDSLIVHLSPHTLVCKPVGTNGLRDPQTNWLMDRLTNTLKHLIISGMMNQAGIISVQKPIKLICWQADKSLDQNTNWVSDYSTWWNQYAKYLMYWSTKSLFPSITRSKRLITVQTKSLMAWWTKPLMEWINNWWTLRLAD